MRPVYVVVHMGTGEISHVWEADHEAEIGEVPLWLGRPVDPADPRGAIEPDPSFACVRILSCDDSTIEVTGPGKSYNSERIRELLELDGLPLDLSKPGLPAMRREDLPPGPARGALARSMAPEHDATTRQRVVSLRVPTQRPIPGDAARASSQLRWVGALRRRS